MIKSKTKVFFFIKYSKKSFYNSQWSFHFCSKDLKWDEGLPPIFQKPVKVECKMCKEYVMNIPWFFDDTLKKKTQMFEDPQ